MQKGFVIGWVLILVMVLVTLGGGYYYWQQKNSPDPSFPKGMLPDGNLSSNQPSEVSKPSDSPASSSAQVANWKTHTNVRLGFSIKYPPDWNKTEEYNPHSLLLSPLVIKGSPKDTVVGLSGGTAVGQ